MRFIHTSDWHIGRLFQNISLLEDQLFALAQIKQYIEQHNVDALIVAGDIFDRAIPPSDAVDALDNFLQSLQQLSIQVIMISGNHDSAQRLGFGSKHMQQAGLHILADLNEIETPVIVSSNTGDVAFYGIPYHDPVQVREAFATKAENISIKNYDDAHTYCVDKILAHKKQHHKELPTVLLSHCFIDGATESDSERPLSIGGADRVSWQPVEPFNYVALGHLHGPQFKGKEHIRYSGTPIKYSFSEHKQNKSVTLVDIDENGNVKQQQLPILAKHNMRIVEGELQQIIDAAKLETEQQQQDYILARLTDTQVILDAMGRLRSVYPNVLQLERPNFERQSNSRLAINNEDGNSNKRSEEQIFSEFFSQVMNCELTEEQQQILFSTISEAKQQLEQQ